MFRRLIGFTLILGLLFGVLTAVSTVIGRGDDPPVAIALLYPEQPSSIVKAADRIALFDLKHLLRVNRLLPLKAVQQSGLNYPPDGNATVSIYEMNVPKKIYKTGLYIYNYLFGTLTDIFTAQSDQPFHVANSNYFYNFFPATSSDGDRVVFIHPEDHRLYIYDTRTQQSSPLGDFQLGTGDRSSALNSVGDVLTWSPDNHRILLKLGPTVYIFEVDSGEYHEYQFDDADFYPTWAGDGQHLWLQRYMFSAESQNEPIEIIDIATGEENPLTKDLSGTSPWWWACDGEWLTYVVINEDKTQREGFILNMRDGTTIRVNDTPLLKDVSIGQISSFDDCQTFAITTQSPNVSNSMMLTILTTRPTYLFDLPTRSADYLGEISSLVQLTDDGALEYQMQVPNTDLVQVFRRTLKPLGEPTLVREITAKDSIYVNWAPDLSYAVYLASGAISYWGPLNFVDASSGRHYELTSADEFVQTYTLSTWQDVKSGRLPE